MTDSQTLLLNRFLVGKVVTKHFEAFQKELKEGSKTFD
jgi:hypothetical protein